jgi:hypothetical protein
MSATIALFVGWVERLRDPTLWCRIGNVGSREELDPTYASADEVLE